MGKETPIVILGAGPAGIAAAVYLKRAGLNPMILEKQQPGGLLRHAFLVENYPGFPQGISGANLAIQFVQHLIKLELSITKAEVNRLEHRNNAFIIQTKKGRLVSSAVIIASGTKPKKLSIPSAAPLEGKRLFYEPSKIPSRTKKRISVIGGGDIAFDYTLTLLEKGHEVALLSRSEPVCLPLLKRQVQAKGASIQVGCVVQKIQPDRKGLLLKCRQQDRRIERSADYLLIAIGREPSLSFLTPRLMRYYTKSRKLPQTSLPGLYFAGDVVRGTYRQTGIAVGDGMYAAMMAQRYLQEKEEAS